MTSACVNLCEHFSEERICVIQFINVIVNVYLSITVSASDLTVVMIFIHVLPTETY